MTHEDVESPEGGPAEATPRPALTAAAWVRATTIGWFLGFLIMLALIAGAEVFGAQGQAVVGLGIGGGVGYWQSRALRGWLAQPRQWVVASVVGMGAPFIAWDLSVAMGRDTVLRGLPACVVTGGLLVAVWQWRLLRSRGAGAAWWIAACWIGWMLPVAAVALNDWEAVPPPWGEMAGLLGIFLGGAMLGAVTARPITRILRGATPAALALVVLAALGSALPGQAPPPPTEPHVVSGVSEGGLATEQWLAMLRRRLPRAVTIAME